MKAFTLLAFAASAVAAVLPSEDPFYSVPEDIGNYAPGDVVKVREISTNINGILPGGPTTNVEKAFQYFYRSTNAIGEPTGAITTLLKPHNADPEKLLAYQQAYDSASNNCAPSYALQEGANTTAIADIVMINAALNQGWYVVTPDFEGLNAAFTVGRQSGYLTLDSVRAALRKGPETAGLSPHARYAMWGYSGGSIGSEWAAEMQEAYAPELKFEGVAVGGMTPNITSVLYTINKGPFSGLAFSGIFGFIKAYPNLTDYAAQTLIPEKQEQFYGIANGCLAQAAVGGAFQDLFTYAKSGEMIVQDEIPRSVLAASGQMATHGTPRFPMYMYKALGDEISPAADTQYVYDTHCRNGAIIEYVPNIIGEHVTEAILGSAGAFGWIAERLAGKPVDIKSCVTRPVAISAIDLEVGYGLFGELGGLLKVLLGGPLGPLVSG